MNKRRKVSRTTRIPAISALFRLQFVVKCIAFLQIFSNLRSLALILLLIPTPHFSLYAFHFSLFMDLFLAILAFLCLAVGLLGALLPLPGPPLSFAGMLLLEWTRYADFSSSLLWTLGILTLVVTVVDYYIPIWGIKKFGGSQAGMWGSTIGLLVGMFLGPWGIFIGAFVGGLVGELAAGRDSATATRAAFGSFIGFLFGIVLKVALCGMMIWYAVGAVVG
jgi:uncharacterized protein YqgC (DUF456 family)